MEMAYVANKDFIVMVDNLYNIVCYRYQDLAMDHMNPKGENASRNPTINESPKKINAEWTFSFGEFVLDIQTVLLEKWYIVVLGEKNLCVLRDNGTFWFVKKFDLNPNCLCAFANDSRDSLTTIVGTHMSNILIYQNDVLRWASNIPFIPVKVCKANLNDIPGSIVLLSDKGSLTAGYLGTNPSLKIISIPNVPDSSSLDKINQELKELKKALNVESNRTSNPENKLSNCLSMEILEIKGDEGEKIVQSFEVLLQVTAGGCVKKAKMIFHENDFFEVNPIQQEITGLESPVTSELQMKVKHFMPLSFNIYYSVLFELDNAFRTITKRIALPLKNCIELESSTKSGKFIVKVMFKKTFEDKALLTNLFDDIESLSSPSLLSFHFTNNLQMQASLKLTVDETINYQIESNDIFALYHCLKELIRRIRLKSIDYKTVSLVLNFHPLEILCSSINTRLLQKNMLLEHKKELNKFTQHYRVLQKRILVKIKDKNPSSLDNLEKLLDIIHIKVGNRISILISYPFLQINKSVENINTATQRIMQTNHQVWLHIKLFRTLLKLLTKVENQILEKFLKVIAINQMSDFSEVRIIE